MEKRLNGSEVELRKIEQIIAQIGETKSGGMLWKKKPKFNTQKVYALGLQAWAEYYGKGLDETVEEYIADVKANRYEAADKWEQSIENFGISLREKHKGATPGAFVTAIVSLINANVPKSMKVSVDIPKGFSREIPPITIEELREADKVVKLRERALIRFLKDSGMSKADAITVNYGQIRRELERGDRFIHLRVTRGKENVRYETFIGPNTTDILRLCFRERQRGGETLTDESPIFVDNKGDRLNDDELAQILARIRKKTGYVISSHRLRKFFETYMAIGVRHPIVLKYWMGHKVRGGSDVEARYIIPPQPEQLKMYMEAYKNIDLEPQTQGVDLLLSEIRARMETLPSEARKQFLTEATTQYREHSHLILNDKRVRELLKEKPRRPDGGCADGEHCGEYKQVPEVELLKHLKEGWTVTHKLQNGDLIIQR